MKIEKLKEREVTFKATFSLPSPFSDLKLPFTNCRPSSICLCIVNVPVPFQTRKSASWLAEKMTADGHSVALLSGEITVEQRIAVLNRFREGKNEKLLITTNVCARGIDVEQVTWLSARVVRHYDQLRPMNTLPFCLLYPLRPVSLAGLETRRGT